VKHLIYSTGFRWLHLEADGVGPVITVVTLRRLASELLGLFSPLYVYGIAQGLGMTIQKSILVVIVYALLIYLSKFLTLPLAENASFRFGYRRTLILSTVPFFVFIGLLVLSQSQPLLLIFVAIFWGIHAALFWFGYHGLFVKRGDHNHFGKQTGLSQALYILVGIIAPILGGLVVLNFGFQALFIAAGAIFALGVMVALLSPEIKPRRDARIANVFELFKTHKRVVMGYIGWASEAALYGAIWPVFLFILVGRILAFGEIISAAVLLAAIITYLVGLIVDRIGEKEILCLGAVVNSLTWLARIFIRAPLFIVGMDGFYRVTEQMLQIPLDVKSYKKALAGGTGRALYFREISLGLGAVIVLTIAAVLIFLNFPLWSVFLLGAAGALAPIFATRRD
jgi:hypothetical protein